MIKFYLILVLFLIFNNIKCNGKIWNPIGSGGSLNFQDINNWVPPGEPISTDDIIINGTTIVNINSTVSVNSIVMNENSTINLFSNLKVTIGIIMNELSVLLVNQTIDKTFQVGNITVIAANLDVIRGQIAPDQSLYIKEDGYVYCEEECAFGRINNNANFVGTYGAKVTLMSPFSMLANSTMDFDTSEVELLKSTPTDISHFESNSYTSLYNSVITNYQNFQLKDYSTIFSFWNQFTSTTSTIELFDLSLLGFEGTTFTSNNSTFILHDKSIIDFRTSIFKAKDIQFTMNNSSKLSINGSQVQISNALITMNDNSFFTIYNGSTISIEDSNQGGFIMKNQSICKVDNSILSIKGHLTLKDSSFITIVNEGLLNVDRSIHVQDYSYIKVDGSSQVKINDEILLSFESYVEVKGSSRMDVEKTMRLQDGSRLSLNDASMSIGAGGVVYVNSSIQAINANIHINGNLYSSQGPTVVVNSNLTVNGTTNFNGNIQFNQSSIYSAKSINLRGNVIGHDLNVFTQSGNFKIYEKGSFLCINCKIVNANGTLEYDIGSTIHLENSKIHNLAGLIQASFNSFVLSKGSSIINEGSIISSSSWKVDQNSTNTTQTITNSGKWYFIDSKNIIDISFINHGEVNVDSKTSIYFKEFNQYNGFLNLDDSTFESNQEANIYAGIIKGNGLINVDINNSGGSLGDHSSTSVIQVNGTYRQSNNASMNIHMRSDSKSLITIKNLELNGTLSINVSREYGDVAREYTFLIYENSIGDFSDVKVNVYDDQEKRPFGNCDYTIKKGKGFYALLINSCEIFDNESLRNSYIAIVTITISLSIILAAFLIYKDKIFRNIGYYQEKKRFERYTVNRDLSRENL